MRKSLSPGDYRDMSPQSYVHIDLWKWNFLLFFYVHSYGNMIDGCKNNIKEGKEFACKKGKPFRENELICVCLLWSAVRQIFF